MRDSMSNQGREGGCGSGGGVVTLWACLLVVMGNVAAPAAEAAGLVIQGAVTDAGTGDPIARFRLIPASQNVGGGGPYWQPHLIKTFERGLYEWRWPNPWERTRFRVEAEGYRPSVSRVVEAKEGEVVLHFDLKRDPGLWGTVRSPAGAPVAKAQVLHSTVSKAAWVAGGRVSLSGLGPGLGAVVVETGLDGGFRLPPEVDPGTVVVAHERHGYAEVDPEALAREPVVTLRPWGRVEGRVLAGAAPVPGRLVTLSGVRPIGRGDACIYLGGEATTDASGRFAFAHAAPGCVQINRATRNADGGWTTVASVGAGVEVRSNETARLVLGGEGQPVVGRVRAGAADGAAPRLRLFPGAPHFGLQGDEVLWKEYGRFTRSDEGRSYFRDDVPLAADGTFRLEGVPQGRYNLQVWASAPAGHDSRFVAGCTFEVPATADGRSDQPLDLGELSASGRSARRP